MAWPSDLWTNKVVFVVVVSRRAYTKECNAVLPINIQNTDTGPQHCTSSTVHYISPQDGCTSTPNIAGVMSHVRHPLINYTTSTISTAHKDTLKNAGGLTKLTKLQCNSKKATLSNKSPWPYAKQYSKQSSKRTKKHAAKYHSTISVWSPTQYTIIQNSI